MKKPSLKKKRTRPKLPYPYNITDPDNLFTLINISFYSAGTFKAKVPVIESIEVYKEIKRLILLGY